MSWNTQYKDGHYSVMLNGHELARINPHAYGPDTPPGLLLALTCLISAAPDLLEEGRAALSFMEETAREHSIADTKTENALRAAIDKAEGA